MYDSPDGLKYHVATKQGLSKAEAEKTMSSSRGNAANTDDGGLAAEEASPRHFIGRLNHC